MGPLSDPLREDTFQRGLHMRYTYHIRGQPVSYKRPDSKYSRFYRPRLVSAIDSSLLILSVCVVLFLTTL